MIVLYLESSENNLLELDFSIKTCFYGQTSGRWVFLHGYEMFFQSSCSFPYIKTLLKVSDPVFEKNPTCRSTTFTLFQPGFFGFLWPGEEGGFHHPPPENNVTVELGQWNLAHVCSCQKNYLCAKFGCYSFISDVTVTSSMFFWQRYRRFAYVCKSSFIS